MLGLFKSIIMKAVLATANGVTSDEYGAIITLVKNKITRICECLVISYPVLNPATGRNVLRSLIEGFIFDPTISGLLLRLTSELNKKEEAHLGKILQSQHFLLRAQADLKPNICLPARPGDPTGYAPYSEAIAELTLLSVLPTPLAKIQCVLNTVNFIMSAVSQYYGNNSVAIGNGRSFLSSFNFLCPLFF